MKTIDYNHIEIRHLAPLFPILRPSVRGGGIVGLWAVRVNVDLLTGFLTRFLTSLLTLTLGYFDTVVCEGRGLLTLQTEVPAAGAMVATTQAILAIANLLHTLAVPWCHVAEEHVGTAFWVTFVILRPPRRAH